MEKTAKPPNKTARTSYEAHAAEKGFKKVPALAVVKAAMQAVAAKGEEVSAKAIAASLRADGFDIDRRWCAQIIATHHLERQTALAAVREVQVERARSLGEVIDLAPAFHANAAVKGAITTIAVRIARAIEEGTWPMPETPADAKALLSVVAMAEQSTSEAAKANIESALLVPAGLANGARNVTPERGRFSDILDGERPRGRFAHLGD